MLRLAEALSAVGVYETQLENSREAIHEAEQALYLAGLKAVEVQHRLRDHFEFDVSDAFTASVGQELRQILSKIHVRQQETRQLHKSISAELSVLRARIRDK